MYCSSVWPQMQLCSIAMQARRLPKELLQAVVRSRFEVLLALETLLAEQTARSRFSAAIALRPSEQARTLHCNTGARVPGLIGAPLPAVTGRGHRRVLHRPRCVSVGALRHA